jgi:CRP-like cAMP-binding protein
MRLTGCTGLHSLEQRCARWILTTLDRVHESRFAVTHEFLAMLMGVSRPTVSMVIESFCKRAILNVERGQVIVSDRRGLLATTCDCYEVIKENYEQVGR